MHAGNKVNHSKNSLNVKEVYNTNLVKMYNSYSLQLIGFCIIQARNVLMNIYSKKYVYSFNKVL